MTYIKIGAAVLLVIISIIMICVVILPLIEELSELKDKRKEVFSYIGTCLATDRKLDLDAVLLTIMSMLEDDKEKGVRKNG